MHTKHTHSYRRGRSLLATFVTILLVLVALPVAAEYYPEQPVRGEAFDSLKAAQQKELQYLMEIVFPESHGYLVTGPLDPLLASDITKVRRLYQTVRVICPDLESFRSARDSLAARESLFQLSAYRENLESSRRSEPAGYRGAMALIKYRGSEHYVQILTVGQLRWLIWARHILLAEDATNPNKLEDYAAAVSDYMYMIDQGLLQTEPPRAFAWGLPPEYDIFAEPPDYVISGYQNYKDFLHAHAAIHTAFAKGVLSLVPADSLLAVLTHTAPTVAWPNKEYPMLQQEFRRFLERGGSLHMMETLTRKGFDTLVPGEYLFVVGANRKIRFARELPREEVERIAEKTGRKVARPNHAFLFPGEPVLTAGAFFVEHRDGKPVITHVNAQSGHYFYSNVSATIREDIAQKSDTYLLTLGHFFSSLDHFGIAHDRVSWSKM